MHLSKLLIIYTVLLWTSSALALDEWFCTSESSQIQGNAIQACGIGEAKSEAAARRKAFDNAQVEFRRLCYASDTCPDREVTVEPKRTTCAKYGSEVKCYRMVAYILGRSKERLLPSFSGSSYNQSSTPPQKSDSIYHPARLGMGNFEKIGYSDSKDLNGDSIVTFTGQPLHSRLEDVTQLASFRAIELCEAKGLPVVEERGITDHSIGGMFFGEQQIYLKVKLRYTCLAAGSKEAQVNFVLEMCKGDEVSARPVCHQYLSDRMKTLASNPTAACFSICDAKPNVDLEKCYRRCR